VNVIMASNEMEKSSKEKEPKTPPPSSTAPPSSQEPSSAVSAGMATPDWSGFQVRTDSSIYGSALSFLVAFDLYGFLFDRHILLCRRLMVMWHLVPNLTLICGEFR
jgi:predicted lipid-binding transport protein (Tim44 family)